MAARRTVSRARTTRATTHAAAWGMVTTALVAGVTGVGPPPASGAERHVPGPGVTVLARGLDGPLGLQARSDHRFVVAESGSSELSAVDGDGSSRVLIHGAGGIAGVASGGSKVYAVLGGPNEDGSPTPGDYPAASLLRAGARGAHVTVLANLQDYELKNNPDGQVQFGPDGTPYDALSNPFSLTLSRYGLLVADGGANDVLKVNPRTGHVSTFFVPPNVTSVKACLAAGQQANPGSVGCDSVPTGVAVVGRSVYVSTLGAEVKDAGRVYRLDARTGKVLQVWKGLTAPTGIAVSPDGAIYLSEVLYGSPEGMPPADFDPSTVGRLTRIQDGRRTHVQVTMPTGLSYRDGELYASAWSIAGFFGLQGRGQIVRVRDRAFG